MKHLIQVISLYRSQPDVQKRRKTGLFAIFCVPEVENVHNFQVIIANLS